MSSYKDLDVSYKKHLPKDKSAKIMDFGCGTGRVLNYLSEKGFSNLYGADIDTSNFDELEKAGFKLSSIKNAQAYLKSVANTFDYIIAKDVIYYFDSKEIEIIMQLMYGALKPNGKILIEIFNGSTITGPYVKYKDIYIQLILTEHSLKSLLKNAGFTLNFIGGNKALITGIGSIVFQICHFFEKLQLKLLYFSERGIDEQNPTILTRKVIALASK